MYFKMNNKIFLCKHCEEDNPDNFYPGRYTSCKKCKNKISNKSSVEKNKEETLNKVLLDKQTELLFEKYVRSYQKVFDNYSLKELIDDFKNRILSLESLDKIKENEIITKINDAIKNHLKMVEYCDVLFYKNCILEDKLEIMSNHNQKLEEKHNNLEEKFNEMREENKQMKILLTNFLQGSK